MTKLGLCALVLVVVAAVLATTVAPASDVGDDVPLAALDHAPAVTRTTFELLPQPARVPPPPGPDLEDLAATAPSRVVQSVLHLRAPLPAAEVAGLATRLGVEIVGVGTTFVSGVGAPQSGGYWLDDGETLAGALIYYEDALRARLEAFARDLRDAPAEQEGSGDADHRDLLVAIDDRLSRLRDVGLEVTTLYVAGTPHTILAAVDSVDLIEAGQPLQVGRAYEPPT